MDEIHRPNRVMQIVLGVVLLGFTVLGVVIVTWGESIGWVFAIAAGVGAGALLYQGLFRNKVIVVGDAELRWGQKSWPYAELSVGQLTERTVKGFPVHEFAIIAPGETIHVNSSIYPLWQDLYTELVRRT